MLQWDLHAICVLSNGKESPDGDVIFVMTISASIATQFRYLSDIVMIRSIIIIALTAEPLSLNECTLCLFHIMYLKVAILVLHCVFYVKTFHIMKINFQPRKLIG